jgi:hypothetical protein
VIKTYTRERIDLPESEGSLHKETMIFDCRNEKREIIYRDMYVPGQETRAELKRESILVTDAVRLAKIACRQEIDAK